MNRIEHQLMAFCQRCKANHIFSFPFVSLAILLAISSIAFVANAQEIAPTSTDALDTNETPATTSTPEIESAPTPSQPDTTVRQTTLTPRLQERITNLAANVSNRMDAAVARLTQIAGRLERRIDKEEAAGVNVTIARGHLTDAKDSLQAAKTILADIDRIIGQVVGSESPLGAWQTAKAVYQAAATEIETAKRSLQQAVNVLKQTPVTAELESNDSNN